MANQMPARYVFLVIGVSLILFSPLLLFFIPRSIPMTFYFVKYTWFYYVPTEVYIGFAIGLLFLVVCCALLFFSHMKKGAILFSCLLSIVAVVVFYGSARCYVALDDQGFTYRGVFQQQKQVAAWENVTQIERVEVPAGENGQATYTVTLDNGDIIHFKEDQFVQTVRSKMRAKYSEHKIPVIFTEGS